MEKYNPVVPECGNYLWYNPEVSECEVTKLVYPGCVWVLGVRGRCGPGVPGCGAQGKDIPQQPSPGWSSPDPDTLPQLCPAEAGRRGNPSPRLPHAASLAWTIHLWTHHSCSRLTSHLDSKLHVNFNNSGHKCYKVASNWRSRECGIRYSCFGREEGPSHIWCSLYSLNSYAHLKLETSQYHYQILQL